MASQTDTAPPTIMKSIKSFVRMSLGEILQFYGGYFAGHEKSLSTYCCLLRWRSADNMAEVDSKLATPDGQPLDGVGRNSRGQGEHHSTGLWMGA